MAKQTKAQKQPKTKTVPAAFRVREEAREALEIHADEVGEKPAKLIEMIVENWLKEHPIDDSMRRRFAERVRQRTEKMEKMGLPSSRTPLRTRALVSRSTRRGPHMADRPVRHTKAA